jgi:hypothetical protein
VDLVAGSKAYLINKKYYHIYSNCKFGRVVRILQFNPLITVQDELIIMKLLND